MIRFELKLLSRRMASMAVTLVATTVVFVLIFPFMDDSGLLALLSDKIEMVPEFLIRMFGLGDLPDFTRFPAYYNLCMFYMQVKLCTVASLMGCESLIGEETDGTIEFLYAMPKSRISIVTAKLASRVMMILILNLMYGAISFAVYKYMGEDTSNLIRSVTSAVIPQLSYLMLGMLISAMLPSSHTASTSSMSLFFFTFMLGIVPSLLGRWYKLEYLSPATSVIRYDFMSVGFRPYWPQIKVLCAYSAAALALGSVIYCRKDMKLQ